ncbi:hypothetical protein Bca4012_069866 [Brassica carinata]
MVMTRSDSAPVVLTQGIINEEETNRILQLVLSGEKAPGRVRKSKSKRGLLSLSLSLSLSQSAAPSLSQNRRFESISKHIDSIDLIVSVLIKKT